MKNLFKKEEITPQERRNIWQSWMQNLKDWVWYCKENPHWYDINIQAAAKQWVIRPLGRLGQHLRELREERAQRKLPETESSVGQLMLFFWGSMPRLGNGIRETFLHHRRKAIHSDGRRRFFFEHLQIHPAAFLGGALGVALIAVLMSLYTLGVTARYDGVELGTVSSNSAVKTAVTQVEEITRQTLSDTDYTVDSQLLELKTSVVPRSQLSSTQQLEENLSDQLGLVEYAYALYVNDELVAATTFSGALEELLEQLQAGYHTARTVECRFVEDVEIRQEYVDRSYVMNLGNIAEILYATKSGEVTYTVKSGDTLYDIAIAHDISLSDLLSLNPGYSSSGLHPGDILTISNAVPYLTVVNVERQSYVQDVPYSITYEDDPTMYQGDYEVLSKGVNGKADITANVTYVNGEETDREIVASVTLQQPVTEVQARGTKVRPTWYPTGSFRWPCSGIITDYFGYRDTGIPGATTYHTAIDIANSYGAPIYAADGGTVTYAGWMSSLGYCVIINHGNGYETWYGHCNSLYVSVGDHVYKGEQIAAMGSTGVSSGPHCHFSIKRNGTWVNPLNYLP